MPRKPADADELSADEARRVALRAQGFGSVRPKRPTKTHLLRVARQLNVVQVDAVNVLVRAHYLPFFSRLGPYPLGALDRLRQDGQPYAESSLACSRG